MEGLYPDKTVLKGNRSHSRLQENGCGAELFAAVALQWGKWALTLDRHVGWMDLQFYLQERESIPSFYGK